MRIRKYSGWCRNGRTLANHKVGTPAARRDNDVQSTGQVVEKLRFSRYAINARPSWRTFGKILWELATRFSRKWKSTRMHWAARWNVDCRISANESRTEAEIKRSTEAAMVNSKNNTEISILCSTGPEISHQLVQEHFHLDTVWHSPTVLSLR